jgi:hypothetical protein
MLGVFMRVEGWEDTGKLEEGVEGHSKHGLMLLQTKGAWNCGNSQER